MHFDASGMIHAWDNYPIDNFPPFWEWMASEIEAGNFAISEVAFDEVKSKTPECADWLRDRGIRKIGLSEEILQEATRVKDILGIVADAYNPKGVGENDLLIIASAAIESTVLITEEARQPNLSIKRVKFKMPAVCELEDVGVTCINIRGLIERSGAIFR